MVKTARFVLLISLATCLIQKRVETVTQELDFETPEFVNLKKPGIT